MKIHRKNKIRYARNEILFVNPTGGWETKTGARYFFPIGLLYLHNYLLKNGIPSTIIDTKPQNLSPDDFKRLVHELHPRIIGYTGSPFERHTLHQYIRGIKSIVPDALIIVGGPYFTATAVDCLVNLKDVDLVVRGEGVRTVLELVRAHGCGGDIREIKGITYRDRDGTIIRNDNQLPCDRDECEIDIETFPDDLTYSPFMVLRIFKHEGIKALPILLAEFCLERCTFCFNNNNGRFRSRTIPSVIGEIQSKRKHLKCDYFWMVDPTFTLREKFAFELCEALIKECPGKKCFENGMEMGLQ